MLDGQGRNIDYLRVSLTDRCNLRCIYCMPEEGIIKKDHIDILRFEEILEVIKSCASLGIRKVRYTGGEPLIVKNVINLINETSKIKNIEDISITTNGILLDDMAFDLKKAGLCRVNISLDTLKEDKFAMITRGGDIKKVFSAIEKCISAGLNPVKLNVVLLKGINDDEISDFIYLTKKYPVNVRFIELMPIGEGKKYFDKGMISTEDIINEYSCLIPVDSNSPGTARLYRLRESRGTVGFISPMSCKFCSSCNRIRLTASGTIKPCLHSQTEYDIRNYIGNEIKLTSAIKNIIQNKPIEHHLMEDRESKSTRMMYQIGG